MADNFLEYHREEYELRKAKWLARKNGKPSSFKRSINSKQTTAKRNIQKPEDEAL